MDWKEVYEEWGKQLEADLVESIKSKSRGSNQSANRLAASIKHKLTDNGVQIWMNDYWYWVDKGRKPGAVSQKANFVDWARRKGIDPRKKLEEYREKVRSEKVKKKRVEKLKPVKYATAMKSFAFVAKRKVQMKGYTGIDFIDPVLNDGRIEKLKEQIGENLAKDFKIEIKGY